MLKNFCRKTTSITVVVSLGVVASGLLLSEWSRTPAFCTFASQLPEVQESNDSLPGDWAEGSEQANDGAAREYYNRGAMLPWKNFLGDWVDAQGQAQGNVPFAIARITQSAENGWVPWDITPLVRQWQNGKIPNRGVLLRVIDGSGRAVFASREASDSQWCPRLHLVGEGQERQLHAVADTYLDPSTYRSLGARDELSVSTQPQHILVRFDHNEFSREISLWRAELRLYCVRRSGSIGIGVFACSPHEVEAGQMQYGLALRAMSDQALRGRKGVWLVEDFESPEWQRNWSYSGQGETVNRVTADPALRFVPLEGHALRVRIARGNHYGLNVGFRFRDKIDREPEEIYFRYYLRLADDWNQTVSGGKLPGIAGTYGRAGWGGRRTRGNEGWSARGLFLPTLPKGNPLAGRTPIGSYVYHANMQGQDG